MSGTKEEVLASILRAEEQVESSFKELFAIRSRGFIDRAEADLYSVILGMTVERAAKVAMLKAFYGIVGSNYAE